MHTHTHSCTHTYIHADLIIFFPFLLYRAVSYKPRQTTIPDCSPSPLLRCPTADTRQEPLQSIAFPFFQDTRGLLRLDNCRTACYSSVIDSHGQCYLGVGDMAINDRITPNLVRLITTQRNNNGCQTIRPTLYRSKPFKNVFLRQRNVYKILYTDVESINIRS